MTSPSPTENKSGYPIFDDYTIPELALLLNRREHYLTGIKATATSRRFGPQFKAMASRILQRSIEDLFGPDDEVEEADDDEQEAV